MILPSSIFQARILIVDDLAANVTLLEQMLREAGYVDITATRDPAQVAELHRIHHYDLILLDLLMPGKDGFEVMDELRVIEAGGYLPVLVITAQPEHKLRALRAGAKDFVSKPFDLAEVLARVYNMIEVRLLHQETKRLYDQLVAETKRSERLLLNVLPASIAKSLNGQIDITADSFPKIVAESFPEVTVLFADIVGFTKFAEGLSAEVLVGVLNEIFTQFDRIAETCGLEKIKTSGDSYMAAAGLPLPVADHAVRAAHMALDMMGVMDRFNQHSLQKLKLRIGINTGTIVAGVVGQRKFLYDLWGEVVNTASRMESSSLPGRIQITDSTRQRLGEPFVFEKRGIFVIDGREPVHTWYLTGWNG